MDIKLARIIALSSFRAARELTQLIDLLRDNCSAEEARAYGLSIAIVVGELGDKISQKIYDEHPDLQKEFEENIEKFGRAG